eukprot:4978742-Pleurochrysis_carterae.AAC.3
MAATAAPVALAPNAESEVYSDSDEIATAFQTRRASHQPLSPSRASAFVNLVCCAAAVRL